MVTVDSGAKMVAWLIGSDVSQTADDYIDKLYIGTGSGTPLTTNASLVNMTEYKNITTAVDYTEKRKATFQVDWSASDISGTTLSEYALSHTLSYDNLVTGSNLWSAYRNDSYVYNHQEVTTTLIGSFAGQGADRGVALDTSGNLLVSSDSKNHIYIHDGITSTITGSFATPGGTPVGIAVGSTGDVYSADQVSNHIYHHNKETATLLGSFAIVAGVTDLAFHPTTNDLYYGNTVTDHIYWLSGTSSTLLGSIAGPKSDVTGVCFDLNGNLISADNGTGHVYIHNGFSTTITGSIATPKSDVQAIAIIKPGVALGAPWIWNRVAWNPGTEYGGTKDLVINSTLEVRPL